MRNFGLYTEIIKLSLKEFFAYPVNFIGRLLIHGFRIAVFGFIYSYVFFEHGSDVNGYNGLQAIWSVALVQIIYQVVRNNFRSTRDDILSGHVEMRLNKPYSYNTYSFLETIGPVPVKLLFILPVTGIVLAFFFGVPDFTFLQIIAGIVFFSFGIIIHVLSLQIIGLFSFWIENSDPIYWIVSKLSWFVNGTFVPLMLLPQIFRTIGDIFPMTAPFFIGRVFEITAPIDLFRLVLIQVFWIIFMVILMRLIYQKGISKLSIHGG